MTKFMAKAYTTGLMETGTKEIGLILIGRAKVCSNGGMEIDTKVILQITKEQAKVYSNGQMEIDMKAHRTPFMSCVENFVFLKVPFFLSQLIHMRRQCKNVPPVIFGMTKILFYQCFGTICVVQKKHLESPKLK